MKQTINFNADATDNGGSAEEQFIEKVKAETSKAIETKFAELNANDSTKELAKELDSIKSQIKASASIEQVESLQNELNTTLLSIKSMNESKKVEGIKTFATALAEALHSKKAEIDSIVANGGHQEKSLTLEVKSAVTMSVDGFTGASTLATLPSQFSGIVSPVRSRLMTYMAVASVGTTSANLVTWVEETDQQGNPVYISEGSGKTKLSSIWAEKYAPVKKVGVYGKVTTEMLADLPQLIAYIQNSLMKRMDLAVENGLFSGNGSGAEIKGLTEYATTFDAGDLAGTIVSPNNYDVIEAVANQVILANGIPTALFVHPTTLAQMHLTKDNDYGYVMPPFSVANGTQVSGMQIIPTTAVSAGDFIGGDMSVVNVAVREEATIQIGLDGNDFTNNQKTILVEKRLAQFVSANDTPVLVQGSFATAKTALAD